MKYLISALLLFSVNGFGQALVPQLGGSGYVGPGLLASPISDYQLGDNWGKEEVTQSILQLSESIERAALATARIGGATGFVLGEFDGDVVVATNHHVCPSGLYWSCGSVTFPMLNIRARRKAFLGTWKELDLTLMSLNISGSDRKKLLQVARNFDFSKTLIQGLPLVTSGFGVAGNPNRKMMINFDEDCRVISANEEFRLMGDPDSKNPGPDKVWSFANACDVSHGDSGSAMVDETTGSPVGLIWTGRIPKSPQAQNSQNILNWETNQADEVWEELSYAVPAKKIQEVLREKLQSGKISGKTASIIEDLITL